MTTTKKYDPSSAAETLFQPLADPARREADPVRALKAAHDLRCLVGVAELGAVSAARAQGVTWDQIGEALGTTRQNVQQRFAMLVRLHDAGPKVEVGHLVAAAAGPRPRRSPKGSGRQMSKRGRR